MYALIEFAGKQFKVEEGSSIKVPYVDGKVGSKVNFEKLSTWMMEKIRRLVLQLWLALK